MTPNHTQIIDTLQVLVISHPGVPLQVAAWQIRAEFENCNWYYAYRAIQVGVRNGSYPGLQIRSHDSGIATLYPAPIDHNGTPIRAFGRPKIPVDLKRAKIIRERLRKARKPYGWAKVAAAMGDVSYTSLRRALLEDAET